MAARRLSADLRPPSPPLPPSFLFPSFDNRSHGEKKRGREGWDVSCVELHFVVIVVLVVLLVVARFFPSLFFSVIFLSSTERNIYKYKYFFFQVGTVSLENFEYDRRIIIVLYIYIYIFVYVNILLYYYYRFREKCEKNLRREGGAILSFNLL